MARPARLALVLISTSVYFSLAILGWGGFTAFFSHAPLIALAVVTAFLVIVSCFAGGNLSSGVREDRSNRWVLIAFGIIGLLNGYLPACSDRIGFWTIDNDVTRWVGVFVFAAGSVLRILPVFILGDRFSGLVAIQPAHTLVTNGIYRVIRHPSYLGLFLVSLGWVLAFRSGVGLLVTACLIPPLVARIRAEEALLLDQFGDEYRAYRSRTSRLIPGIY